MPKVVRAAAAFLEVAGVVAAVAAFLEVAGVVAVGVVGEAGVVAAWYPMATWSAPGW
jgi:hypothetical protein